MSFKDTIKNKIWNTFTPKSVLNQIESSAIDTWTHLISLDNDSETLTENSALNFSSLYSVINVLASDIGSLPIHVYKKDKNGKREKLSISDNNVAYLLNKKVNNDGLTPFTFKSLLVSQLAIYGNSYTLMRFDSKGDVIELLPLDPGATTVYRNEQGEKYYKTTQNNQQITLFSHEVIHVKNPLTTVEGLGISPLKALKLNVESQRAGDELNHTLLHDNGVPKGVLSVQGVLNAEAKERVRKEWKRANSSGAVAILDSSLEYKSLGQNLAELDYLQGQEYSLNRIASVYRVPSHKLNLLDRATFSNVTEQNIDYISSTLTPILKNIEEELSISLFTDKEVRAGFYVKFNINALLRSEPETLARTLEIQLRAGMISLDESRDLLEMNRYDEEWSRVPYLTKNYSTLSDETLNNEPEGKEVEND